MPLNANKIGVNAITIPQITGQLLQALFVW
jgi:hypothetical protein